MKKYFLYFMVMAIVAMTACIVIACKDNKNQTVAVFGVKLNESKITLEFIGDKEQLIATVIPNNATNKLVTWRSSNTDVAEVDDDGWVVAIGEGESEITVVTVERGYEAKCVATVPKQPPVIIPVSSISLNETDLTLYVNETFPLQAIVEPADATNKAVRWSSSDFRIASVNASSGLVTANGEGEVDITVTTVDGLHSTTCHVKVGIPVANVSFRLDAIEMIVGRKQVMTATVFPLDAVNRNISWSSANQNVAEIDENGMVTAKTVGQSTITVKTEMGGREASILVKVVPAPPYSEFVRTYGSKFVLKGEEIVFNGMGFYHGNSNGPPNSSFYDANYAKMAELGFNSIRLYVSARNFENSDASATPYREAMFTWLDNHLAMAQKYNLMVVLAMIHSPLANGISDEELFTDVNRQTRLANLWGEIAKRYKDNKTIAGFDLTNEPNVRVENVGGWGAPYNCVGTPYLAYFDLYMDIIQRIVVAIREVDQNHIIIAERLWLDGGHYSFHQHDQRDCWQNFDGKFDFPDINDPANNYAYTYHCYEPNTYTHQDPITGNNRYPSSSIGRYNEGPNEIPPWLYCKEYLDYAYTVPLNYIWNVKNVPAYIGELGIFTTNFDNNRGGAQWIADVYDICLKMYGISCNFHPYYIHEITTQFDTRLQAAFKKAFETD